MEERRKKIEGLVKGLGFSGFGVSKATFLEEEARYLEDWLSQGKHGTMSYMEKNFDLRVDPRKLVPGAKSVISLSFNYYMPHKITQEAPKLAMYALGEDYHFVIKDKLRTLMSELEELYGEINGRVFVDSAPILEKAWAERGGLGWRGKSTNLINKRSGSYFFLAEIISDLEIEEDTPATDHCGTCTRCIDACPTEALKAYEIDASRCISYLTIELREEIPDAFTSKMEGWAFGCDICQIVCPWNRFSTVHEEPRLMPRSALKDSDKQDWIEMTQEVFSRVFSKSAVKRTKHRGFIRNLRFLEKKNSND